MPVCFDAGRPARPAPRAPWIAAVALLVVASAEAQAPETADTPYAYRRPDIAFAGGSLAYAREQQTTARVAAERLRRFPDSPYTVGWLMRAKRVGDALDVLARVVQRTPARLPDVVEGFDTSEIDRDQSHGYRQRLAAIVDSAMTAQASLEPEAAAAVATALLAIAPRTEADFRDPFARHRRIIEAYPGTRAARLLEVDLATSGRLTRKALNDLEAIAGARPGTEAAAKARYSKGFHLAHNYQSLVLSGGADPDPTDAFFEVLDIVADLGSGRYPACTWVEQAPELVTGWYMYQPRLSPQSARRMLDGMHRFVSTHTSLFDSPVESRRPAYLVTSWMPIVASFLPDGAAVMAAHFDAFEREWPEPGDAKLLRASWLQTRPEALVAPAALPPPSPTRDDDVRALLESASQAPTDRVARQALARLAESDFADPAQGERARTRYAEYVTRFPAAPDAWIAAMRLAQLEQVARRPVQARALFDRVATTYATDPLVVTLARAYAGRQAEAQNDFPEAARQYGLALAAWPDGTGGMLSLDLPIARGQQGTALGDPLVVNRAWVQKPALEARLAELRTSLTLTGGPVFERGRWLLNEGRADEAVAVFEAVLKQYGAAGAGPLARRQVGRARIDAAVAGAGMSNDADVARTLATLDAVAGEYTDATGGIGGVIAATMRFQQGKRDEADRGMSAALTRWVRDGVTRAPTPAAGSLEAEVLAVRDAVFRPLGHPVLGSRWNAAEWPKTLPRFVVALSSLRVKGPGIEARDVDVARPPAGLASTLFLSADDMAYLTRAIARLGGTLRRDPASVMEVPNQPLGAAAEIVRWWNSYFPSRPGHWAGFEIQTYPAFGEVEFTNAERTRALVPLAVGYSGATAVVEKVNGVWTMKELVNFWIT